MPLEGNVSFFLCLSPLVAALHLATYFRCLLLIVFHTLLSLAVLLCLCLFSGWRDYVSEVFVHLCVTVCINLEQTWLAWYFEYLLMILTKLSPPTNFEAKMNMSNFGVKRSMVKVTVESNVPQDALFWSVVFTHWWRQYSRQSRNHHLVLHILHFLVVNFISDIIIFLFLHFWYLIWHIMQNQV